jgi:hypothetical protein
MGFLVFKQHSCKHNTTVMIVKTRARVAQWEYIDFSVTKLNHGDFIWINMWFHCDGMMTLEVVEVFVIEHAYLPYHYIHSEKAYNWLMHRPQRRYYIWRRPYYPWNPPNRSEVHSHRPWFWLSLQLYCKGDPQFTTFAFVSWYISSTCELSNRSCLSPWLHIYELSHNNSWQTVRNPTEYVIVK